MKKALLILIVQLCAYTIRAQIVNYHQYTTDDGLPSNNIYGVIEDDDGYIWAFTDNGISKFDGYKFQNFSIKDGLQTNDVYIIRKGDDGKLWLGGQNIKPSYYENGIVIIDSLDSKFSGPAKQFNNIIYSVNACIQSETNDCYYCIKPFEKLEDFVNSNKHWINLETLNSKKLLQDQPLSTWHYIEIKGDTYGLIFTKKDIIILNFKTEEFKRIPTKGIINNFINYTVDHFGDRYYVATDLGYFEIDDELNLNRSLYHKNIYTKYLVNRIYVDSKKNTWISTNGNGLLLVDKVTKTFHFNELNEDLIKFQSLNGNLYAFTKDSDIYLIKDNSIKLINNHLKLKLQSVFTYNDNLILLTDKNAYLFDGKYCIPIKQEEAFKWNEHYGDKYNWLINLKSGVYEAHSNLLYFSTRSSIFKLDLLINHLDTIHKRKSLNIIGSKDGGILFSSGKKLLKYSNNQVDTLCTFDEETTMIKEFGNTIYTCIKNKGLYAYNKLNQKLIQVSNNKYPTQFLKFNNDIFLINSIEGIELIKEKNNQYIQLGIIGKDKGLLSNNIKDIHLEEDSLFIIADRRLYTVSLPQWLQETQKQTGEIKIDSIKINNAVYTLDSTYTINSYDRNIELNYKLINFASKGDITYEYTLIGKDTIQNNIKSLTTRFERLEVGEYTLELNAIDIHNNKYPLKQRININIKPYIWETTLFKLILLALFLITLFSVWQFIHKSQLRKLEEKKNINKKISHLQMESLRSQMNPHFIFNSLGSIQYYIQTNKMDEADEYLTMFSQLMRRYLDSAIENMISLENEISLLKEYTHLEMLRFDKSFDTIIEIDQNLPISETYIPTMLIQPFVENAINHGLQLRKAKGAFLKIIFEEKNNTLLCKIIDNGIGRELSKKYKLKHHVSRGMQNVKNRISVLQSLELATIDIDIRDYDTQSKEYKGTSVTIRIKNLSEDEI